MSKELNKNLLSSINIGAEIMVHSLAAHVTMSKIPKKKLTKQQARDNYCKSVLFLWGFMQYDFENVDEDMFYRCQMVSANILFKVLSRKEFESLYLGAGLNKRKSNDPPKLCHEMVDWFKENHKLEGVQSIITTGKHVFTLKAFSNKLEDKYTEALYKAGSLCEEGLEGINCMKSILVDSKIKLNF